MRGLTPVHPAAASSDQVAREPALERPLERGLVALPARTMHWTWNDSASQVISETVSHRTRHSPRPIAPAVSDRTRAESGSPSTIENTVSCGPPPRARREPDEPTDLPVVRQLDPPRRQVVRERAAGRAGPEHLLAHRLGLLGLAEVGQGRVPGRGSRRSVGSSRPRTARASPARARARPTASRSARPRPGCGSREQRRGRSRRAGRRGEGSPGHERRRVLVASRGGSGRKRAGDDGGMRRRAHTSHRRTINEAKRGGRSRAGASPRGSPGSRAAPGSGVRSGTCEGSSRPSRAGRPGQSADLAVRAPLIRRRARPSAGRRSGAGRPCRRLESSVGRRARASGGSASRGQPSSATHRPGRSV